MTQVRTALTRLAWVLVGVAVGVLVTRSRRPVPPPPALPGPATRALPAPPEGPTGRHAWKPPPDTGSDET